MKTFLLQGDSITDAGRSREDNGNRGIGYPTLIAAELMYDYPGRFNVINRGISGNRVVDLYARLKKDFLNHRPDYLSILIGVNDVWHDYGTKEPNGVPDERFRKVYDLLIEEILAELPDVKIYILEPFALLGTGTQEDWAVFSHQVRLRAESAKWIAKKYGLTFIPLQQRFEDACRVCEASYWLRDGVHPTAAGHELIARALLEAVRKDI